MVLGNIKRLEIIIVRFHLRPFGHIKTHAHKYFYKLVAYNGSACLAILEELHLSQAVGPYQIALQTERAPYGITLQFQEACPQGALSSATEYLRFCGTVFQALVGNGDRFSWELPLEGSDTPARGTVEKTPWDTTSLTAFLPAWQQALEEWLQESPLFQTTRPE